MLLRISPPVLPSFLPSFLRFLAFPASARQTRTKRTSTKTVYPHSPVHLTRQRLTASLYCQPHTYILYAPETKPLFPAEKKGRRRHSCSLALLVFLSPLLVSRPSSRLTGCPIAPVVPPLLTGTRDMRGRKLQRRWMHLKTRHITPF